MKANTTGLKLHPDVVVRGGGDIATGSIYMLWKAGLRVVVLETQNPSAIRRQVALSEAVYDGTATVEDLTATLVQTKEQIEAAWQADTVPVLVDPDGTRIESMYDLTAPIVIVDAILAKQNLGTNHERFPNCPLIALGPGFTAGAKSQKDCVDVVIETMRGHNLGRMITEGCAIPNTGIPGSIAGVTKERVIHAEVPGIMDNVSAIGDIVKKGQVIAYIKQDGEAHPVCASIDGLLRGLLRSGYPVTKGFKIADIDPRESEHKNCFTISDKARCIGGSVLTMVCKMVCNLRA